MQLARLLLSGAVSLIVLLTFIFFVMKQAKFGFAKDWSWIWVFSPFWISGSLLALVIILICIQFFLQKRD